MRCGRVSRPDHWARPKVSGFQRGHLWSAGVAGSGDPATARPPVAYASDSSKPVCPLYFQSEPYRERAMAKGKEARGLIKLQSSESSHCYFTQKNRNNSKERIQLKKYDPTLRKRVMYKEAGKL